MLVVAFETCPLSTNNGGQVGSERIHDTLLYVQRSSQHTAVRKNYGSCGLGSPQLYNSWFVTSQMQVHKQFLLGAKHDAHTQRPHASHHEGTPRFAQRPEGRHRSGCAPRKSPTARSAGEPARRVTVRVRICVTVRVRAGDRMRLHSLQNRKSLGLQSGSDLFESIVRCGERIS